jgi:hypothetical protein
MKSRFRELLEASVSVNGHMGNGTFLIRGFFCTCGDEYEVPVQ